MSGFKAGLGLAILSALCVCVVGVGSASALTAHECIERPQVQVGTGVRYEAGCKTKNATGAFELAKIAGGFNVVKVTPGGTGAAGVRTLAATVGGVKFKISCTTQSGSAKIENKESSSQVIGKEILVSYEGCLVTEPAGKGCTVPSTITTNKLKSETPKETMNSVYAPESGETFVTIKVSGCSVTALNGEKPVTGSATSVVQEAEPLVQEFTATSGSALKFGGQAATFLNNTKLDTNDGTPIFLATP